MTQRQTFEVWISKYALTTGVFKVQAELAGTSTGMIVVRHKNGAPIHHYHGEGRDWHRSRQGAEVKANEMRLAKIMSLKRQIKKLETMTFTEKGSEG